MAQGTIKFFNAEKGFGFIKSETGEEYFVHRNGIKNQRELFEGDRVSYEVTEGRKGPEATEVVKL